ncbi:MAG: energy transducer TonB [Spirochaetaceae bacterium]|nr:energy transducer TonB [Spirochaetaceae bacterium]
MTTTATLYDPRLNARLKKALLMAMILHAAMFIALGIRAILVDEEPRGPLTVQLADPPPKPKPKPPPEPAKPAKPAPKQVQKAADSTPAPAKPAPVPQSQPAPKPPPAAAPAKPLPTAPKTSSTPKPQPAATPAIPKPVIANQPPPPPAVSREEAAASAQALAQAALQQLAPTPSAGEKPTSFGSPVGPLADTPPVPVSSSSEANLGRTANAAGSRGATADTLAALDQSLASAASAADSGGSNGAGAGAGAPGLTGQGYGSAGSGDFAWDDPGAGCEVISNPDPKTAGIGGDGMTYHIKVRFRVDASGLVTSAQITEGSGNSALDAAVLTAARRMSFACKAEARGVKSYRVS